MGESHSVSFTSEESQSVHQAVVDARASGKNPRQAALAALGPAPSPENQSAPKEEATAPPEAPPILGKFKTHADLEKAYKELEAKLGAPKVAEPTKEPAKSPDSPPKDGDKSAPVKGEGEAKEALQEVGLNLDTFSQEFTQKGELSEDSYKTLESKGIPKSVVDSYIAGQKAQAAMAEQQLMTESGFKSPDNFGEAVEWAKTNWEAKDLDSYNKAIGTNNPDAVKLALVNLRNAYEGSMGNEPTLVQAESKPSGEASVYKSRQEMAEDMKSKKYKNDPAFRAMVASKLAQSNIW